MSNRAFIVVAIDSSQETKDSIHYAIDIAKQRDAEVHAVQVVPREGTLLLVPENQTGLRARLRTLRRVAEQEGVAVRRVTLRGAPERAIPAYAQLNGASLIVAGRHYGSSRLWRHSAVTSRLSRSSSVPVLIVPARSDAAARWSLNRIVAAVDFTVASAMALRFAADLSARHGARLTMLHAMNPPDYLVFSGGEAWRLAERLPADVKRRSERLRREAIAFGFDHAEPLVVTGAAARGIVETATETVADLIVMGVAPRTRIDEAVSGSTLRAVLRRTKTPVLVLPVVTGAYGWLDAPTAGTTRIPLLGGGTSRLAA